MSSASQPRASVDDNQAQAPAISDERKRIIEQAKLQ